jgi:hypothetical protein
MITLGDLLHTGRRAVEPEVMLGVGEDAYVGFESRHSGRHGRGEREWGVGEWGSGTLPLHRVGHGHGHGIRSWD